jgi:hypothetical protein
LAADGRAAIRVIGDGAVAPRCRTRREGISPLRAAIVRRNDMFERLEDAEKKGSGRTMKIIWIVIAIAAVIFAIISFA